MNRNELQSNLSTVCRWIYALEVTCLIFYYYLNNFPVNWVNSLIPLCQFCIRNYNYTGKNHLNIYALKKCVAFLSSCNLIRKTEKINIECILPIHLFPQFFCTFSLSLSLFHVFPIHKNMQFCQYIVQKSHFSNSQEKWKIMSIIYSHAKILFHFKLNFTGNFYKESVCWQKCQNCSVTSSTYTWINSFIIPKKIKPIMHAHLKFP